MQKETYLSSLPDDMPLSCVNLAGSHDSATAFVAFSKWARCQGRPINEQLEMGIRFLDIRLFGYGDKIRLVHSTADCFVNDEKTERLTFNKALSWCVDFLKKNPQETIVMSVKKDRGLKGPFDKLFFNSFYNKYVAGNDIWFSENRIPTLGEVRGKIVLFRRCKSNIMQKRGLNFSVWKNQKTPSDNDLFKVTLNDEYSATVQDSYAVPPHDKWALCRQCLEDVTPTANKAVVNFLSTSGSGGPRATADIVNGCFEQYQPKADKPLGWIVLDYPTKELCDKIMR